MKTHFSTKPESWFPALIMAAGILSYANSFACPFLFDDTTVIIRNPYIFHLWPPWKAMLFPSRVLADYTFALTYAWAGVSPAEYRLVNIFIHLAAGLFLYGVVRRSLLLPRWNNRFASSASGLALAVALLWTVHPLQTESVTYIAQRYESLMGLFVLATFYCFIRGATAPRPIVWNSAALAACACGMATKEVMVAAPFLVILYDGIFLSPSWRGVIRNRWKLHLAFVATLAIALALLIVSILRARHENVPLVGANDIRWDYALTQLNVLAHYLKLAIIPHPLCLDYLWPLVNTVREALWPGVITVILGCGTLWALWRRSWLGFTGAWFFIILAPTSSFNPLPDVAFEHRMYLPLAAILTLLVITAYLMVLESSRHGRLWGIVLLILTAVWLGALTHLRNETYESREAMWRDVLRQRPDNYRTYIALSSALINQGQYHEAENLCSNLLSRLPPFPGMSTETMDRQYIKPGRPPLRRYYSMAHDNLGQIAMNQGQPDAAKRHYREAIRVFPQSGWAHRDLGRTLYLEKQFDEAIAELDQATQWQPKDGQPHSLLALALLEQKKYQAAADHFEKAISINPDDGFARSQLAWMLATSSTDGIRNGKKAVLIALPLLRPSTQSSPRVLDILAAAYAEAGDFSNAVKSASQAIIQLQMQDKTIPANYSLTDIQKRLALYLNHHPFRE